MLYIVQAHASRKFAMYSDVTMMKVFGDYADILTPAIVACSTNTFTTMLVRCLESGHDMFSWTDRHGQAFNSD